MGEKIIIEGYFEEDNESYFILSEEVYKKNLRYPSAYDIFDPAIAKLDGYDKKLRITIEVIGE